MLTFLAAIGTVFLAFLAASGRIVVFAGMALATAFTPRFRRSPSQVSRNVKMTIMAGIYSRSNDYPPPRIRSELRNLLSRHEADRAVEIENDRVWIAKVDIGAFGSNGVYRDSRGGFSLLTGEPLVGDR